jgi:hypothetical protein
MKGDTNVLFLFLLSPSLRCPHIRRFANLFLNLLPLPQPDPDIDALPIHVDLPPPLLPTWEHPEPRRRVRARRSLEERRRSGRLALDVNVERDLLLARVVFPNSSSSSVVPGVETVGSRCARGVVVVGIVGAFAVRVRVFVVIGFDLVCFEELARAGSGDGFGSFLLSGETNGFVVVDEFLA